MRAFRIPAALMVVASLALLGCGDLGTAPSLDGLGPDLANHVGDPLPDHNGDGIACVMVLNSRTGLQVVVDNSLPDGGDDGVDNDCPEGFSELVLPPNGNTG